MEKLFEKDIIKLRNADIGYPSRTILTELNFNLATAEFAYLVGETGAGKTSFLKTLYAALPLIDGEATICDVDLKRIPEAQIPDLRRKIGMIFQDFMLFDEWTVRDNLDFILKATEWRNADERQDRIKVCLDRVNLVGKDDELVYKLSGGQKQKLAIARAIINDAKLIIADEPTGNLDPKTSDEVLYLLQQISAEQKASILVATHDTRILKKFAARVFHCEGGGIFEKD